jgi:hypothetical protein
VWLGAVPGALWGLATRRGPVRYERMAHGLGVAGSGATADGRGGPDEPRPMASVTHASTAVPRADSSPAEAAETTSPVATAEPVAEPVA